MTDRRRAEIAKYLRLVAALSSEIRVAAASFVASSPTPDDTRLLVIQAATLRISNLMFQIGEWNEATTDEPE